MGVASNGNDDDNAGGEFARTMQGGELATTREGAKVGEDVRTMECAKVGKRLRAGVANDSGEDVTLKLGTILGRSWKQLKAEVWNN